MLQGLDFKNFLFIAIGKSVRWGVLIPIGNPQLPELDRKGPNVQPVVGNDYLPRWAGQKCKQPNLLKTKQNDRVCVVGSLGTWQTDCCYNMEFLLFPLPPSYHWFKHVLTAVPLVIIGLLVLNLSKLNIDLLSCPIQELAAFLGLSVPVLPRSFSSECG